MDKSDITLERMRVRVLFDEEAQHRLEADVAHGHPVAVDAPALVGAQKVGAADGAELPSPLVEHELDVAERLQPRAEARLRLAHALGYRAHPPALQGVEVEDAVRLGKANRAQNDSLGLEGSGHGASLAAVPVESRLPRVR